MQSLKSIRPAEVGNFFKHSFEQKKTDSTVLASRPVSVLSAHSPLFLMVMLVFALNYHNMKYTEKDFSSR